MVNMGIIVWSALAADAAFISHVDDKGRDALASTLATAVAGGRPPRRGRERGDA